jgi:hypothetical protein
MGDWSNKGRNQKVPRIQWKCKYNLPESVEHSKGHAKEKFIAISAYIKKTEIFLINNLIMDFKLLEKQDKSNPKPADGEK